MLYFLTLVLIAIWAGFIWLTAPYYDTKANVYRRPFTDWLLNRDAD